MIFPGMDIVKGIDAIRPRAGREAIILRTKLQFYVREGIVRIVGRSQQRGIGAAKNTEYGGDALMFAHGAQLRQQGAAIGGRAGAVANRGEKAPFDFLLREHDVLIALAETVTTIAVVAT